MSLQPSRAICCAWPSSRWSFSPSSLYVPSPHSPCLPRFTRAQTLPPLPLPVAASTDRFVALPIEVRPLPHNQLGAFAAAPSPGAPHREAYPEMDVPRRHGVQARHLHTLAAPALRAHCAHWAERAVLRLCRCHARHLHWRAEWGWRQGQEYLCHSRVAVSCTTSRGTVCGGGHALDLPQVEVLRRCRPRVALQHHGRGAAPRARQAHWPLLRAERAARHGTADAPRSCDAPRRA